MSLFFSQLLTFTIRNLKVLLAKGSVTSQRGQETGRGERDEREKKGKERR